MPAPTTAESCLLTSSPAGPAGPMFAAEPMLAQTFEHIAFILLSAVVVLLVALVAVLLADGYRRRLGLRELRRLEREVHASRERMAAAEARARIGVWEYRPDRDSGVWSPVMYEIFGRDPARPPPPMREFAAMIHPDDRERMAAAAAEARRRSGPVHVDLRTNPERGPVRHLSTFIECIRRPDGSIDHLGGTTMDITERKQAEQTLRESEERWRTVMENVPNYILLVDRDFRIAYINHVRPGYELAQVIGSDILDYLEEEYREPYRQGIEKVLFQGQPASIEMVARGEPDQWSWYLTRMAPLRKDDGVSALIVATDITEHKRAEERMLASLREKEALLKEIHHRVKNNLQIISSLLSLQAEELRDPALRQAFAETRNRVRSMALLHETLYQSGSLAGIDLPRYLHTLCEQLFRSYGADAERIELDLDVREKHLDLDRAIPCGLMINELVSNALKHAFPSGRRGRVRVELYCDQDDCLVNVGDDGVGLPPGLDWTNSPSLGLRLVNDLTRQLQGSLSLEQQGGTLFRIRFKR